VTKTLAAKIKTQARKEGFVLVGITTPDAPPHLQEYLDWIAAGRHAAMGYLADERARARRADPHLLLPEVKSILVLAAPYPPAPQKKNSSTNTPHGKIAAYALREDYHLSLKEKLQGLVRFIEEEIGHPVPNRWYTDTGAILEKDLAQRAGLGWIGKNSCLINPKLGSYFLLAEILLGIPLPPDSPYPTDHCGTCTRCLDACPTAAILPNRSIDANRCISYLTIENKGEIPAKLRPKIKNLIFGCDICLEVCPWNRSANKNPSLPAAKTEKEIDPYPALIREMSLSPQEFNRKFKNNPVKRAKRRGYLRNVAVALGNIGDSAAVSALETALEDNEPLVREHAQWALTRIKSKGESC
jgi:epoxyqueuosine reductase